MSADSPRRPRCSQMGGANGPYIVSPQQVTDPSIIDSVAGFINDVVPAAYNVPNDAKDQIQWAHFEQLDFDDFHFSENLDCDKYLPPPLFIVLGYTTGVQIWAVPASGEAVEVLSWRHGSVRVLKILPTPNCVGKTVSDDLFAQKRPLIALCDNASPGPHYCSLSILSLSTGEQVKNIKFKNPIIDIQANRRSIVVTFAERIAIFDAFTLEDRLTVTTCYLSPGICSNPIALGTRWMAYAEKKLITAKRSSGGNDGEGVQSYTATVLHAAKSLGKGLRELGETVASSLTGNVPYKQNVTTVTSNSQYPGVGPVADSTQPGVVTVLDIESQNIDPEKSDNVIAHFTAHTEAIVALLFDPSGQLLLTADKRGHDFHLFRIHPHPSGSALAAVHHLYILHRGDTTARVQDMCFSPDSRWVTVSTLRGTTHVFPVTPYGGSVGVRTHATPHVVNRLSRFHRSAGLPAEGRSNSPVSLFEAPVNSSIPFPNPRLPPYPHPTVVHALAQIRQSGIAQSTSSVIQRSAGGRQRLTSSSEDSLHVSLRVRSCIAGARAWIEPLNQNRDPIPNKVQKKPVESLFVMSCHGTLVQYDLDPRHSASIPKEKVCDDTPIDLIVEPKAQWILQRQPNSCDMQLPLQAENLLLAYKCNGMTIAPKPNHNDDRWLSQVEIVTHAGPHRRLWMGPQFTFKTYNTSSGAPLSVMDSVAIDVGRSKPVNMPISAALPVLIESGSVSSCEQSPRLLEMYHNKNATDDIGGPGEIQLREDLADAMLESPGINRDTGGRCVIVSMKHHITSAGHSVAKVVNPLGTVVTLHSDDDAEPEVTDDAVIHENCDEALFRPVVAPKAVLFAEPKSCVQPRAIKSEPPAPIIIQQPDETFDLAHNEIECEVTPEFSDTFEFPVINNEEVCTVSKFFSESLEPINFPAIEKIKPVVHEEEKRDNARVLSNVDLHKYQGLEPDEIVFAPEDVSNAQSDKRRHRSKPTKAKPKLGVRISNIKETTPPPVPPPVIEPIPEPKQSWSSIAAKPKSETQKPGEFDLPEIESIEHSVEMLKLDAIVGDKLGKSKTFELNSENEIELCNLPQAEPLLPWPEDIEVEVGTLIKIDKSSDEDANVNTNSSQTETTESDDSSKVRIETTTAMDTEEDGFVAENKSAISSVAQNTQKVAKKKSKKKRR